MWARLFECFAFCLALTLLAGALTLSAKTEPSQAQAVQGEDRLPYALVGIHIRLKMLEEKAGLQPPSELTKDLDNLLNLMTNEGKK